MVAASRFTSAASSGCATSTASDRFDAERNRKIALSSPSARSAPVTARRRRGSPAPVSTLTTSAPPSASSLVQYAPAIPVDRSTTV
jgi:hypothetical protein